MVEVIKKFSGEYEFLSNFADTLICDDAGIYYTTVEAAFQAAKTNDLELRRRMARFEPKDAKRFGRKVDLRSDWDGVKDEIMYQLVKKKFSDNSFGYRDKLLATRDAELIEGNTWNDRYWGVCRGEGKNKLGQILMRVREEIRNA